jgi:hypothetical protein
MLGVMAVKTIHDLGLHLVPDLFGVDVQTGVGIQVRHELKDVFLHFFPSVRVVMILSVEAEHGHSHP